MNTSKRKRIKLRNTRLKAGIGGESAAILAAAGIGAGATLTAAAIGAKASYDAASQQADSIQKQAEDQAKALAEQNLNNDKLNQQQVQAQKDNFNKINDNITTMNMNLAMLAGNESYKDRAAEGRIQVKKGGKVRRGLRQMSNPFFLQGNYSQPFEVTDGGAAMYRGMTPQGNLLYELKGDNHEQYHKANGKYKTGVGIKFADGGVVEGEGSRKGQGEYLLVPQDGSDGFFISKHTINGFNPAEAINAGMQPEKAFNIQEASKVKPKTKLRVAKCGGRVKALRGVRYDDPWWKTWYNTMSPSSSSSDWYKGFTQAYQNQYNEPFTLGSEMPWEVYQKVWPGQTYQQYIESNYGPGGLNIPEVVIRPEQQRQVTLGSNPFSDIKINVDSASPMQNKQYDTFTPIDNKHKFWASPIGGATISAGANLLGAGISTLGNYLGSRKLGKAYGRAADIMSDAYGKLRTIDINSLTDSNDWRAATYMPTIRSANINVNPQLNDVSRSALRKQNAINNQTLSSAARLNRINQSEQVADEARSRIYADQANREEQIKQKNNEMINQAAAENIRAINQRNTTLAGIRADLMKYNNDILNERVMGPAQAYSQMGINAASAAANALNSSAQSWANALNTSGNQFVTGINSMYKTNADFVNSLALGTPQAQANALIFRAASGLPVDESTVKATYGMVSEDDKARLRRMFPQYKLG